MWVSLLKCPGDSFCCGKLSQSDPWSLASPPTPRKTQKQSGGEGHRPLAFPEAPARCRISLYFSNVRNGFSSSGLNVLNVSAKFKQNSILSVTLTFPPCTGWCSRCELGCAFAEERYWTSRTSCTVYEYDIVWHSMTHHISSLMTATRRNGETKHQSGPIQSGPTLLAYPGVSCSGFSLLMLDTGVTRMLSTSKHQDSVMHFRARS